MNYEEARVDFEAVAARGETHLEFDFPRPGGGRSGTPPRALLSLRSAGSMRYQVELPNLRREGFFASLGLDGPIISTELHHTRRLRFVEAPTGAAEGGAELGSRDRDAAGLPGEDRGDGGPDGAAGRDGIVVLPSAKGRRSAFAGAAITVADCMPIWIHDAASGAWGVLHSGWKGTGILAHAVAGLTERSGGSAATISVILGPAIGACCYEVSAERALRFEREFGPTAVDNGGPAPRLDLRAANLALARRLGIGALLSVDACTACEPALGSYRREGAADFTRMVALCLPG